MIERRRAEEGVRDSEALVRAMLEAALDSIVSIDQEGRIVEFNPAAERVFGWARSEAVGRSMVDLIVPPDLREPHRAGFARYLATGEPRILDRRIEITGLRRDGTEFPVELTIVRVEHPGPPVFTGYIRDLTQQKRLEREFAESQRMDAVGRLAGGIAHDFNNLMTIVQGYGSLLDARLDSQSVAHSELDEIMKAAERATVLTRQLLAFGRRQLLQPRVVPVNEVVEETQRMLARLIGENVELTTSLSAGAGAILVDPGQLEQAIVNLALNARDAMPEGGRVEISTGELEVEEGGELVAGPGTYVVLSVRDTGIGMDEDTRTHLFEPFYTTKEPGRGAGLGLATVYGVVTQSGGTISVESALGEGSTFRIYLPRADAPVVHT
jgi:PAS domain S-box-containing protein